MSSQNNGDTSQEPICLTQHPSLDSVQDDCVPNKLKVSRSQMKRNILRVKKLNELATLPFRASLGAAGYDLSSSEDTVVPAKGKQLVKTGLQMAIEEGYYGRIAPRSSLAWKNFIDVGAGVVDR